MSIEFSVTRSVPRDAKAIGIGVFTEGAVGRALGIDRAGLTALGFDGKPGQACVIAGGNGATTCRARSRHEGRDDGGRRAQGRRRLRARGRASRLARHGHRRDRGGRSEGRRAGGRRRGEPRVVQLRQVQVRRRRRRASSRSRSITPESAVKSTQAGVDRGTAIAQAVAMARDLIEHARRFAQRSRHRGGRVASGEGERPRGRGDGRGRDGEGGHGRHARREQGFGRAASPHQDDVLTPQPDGIGGAGRQGDHVRLRWAVPEVGRGDDVDEDRHVGRGRRARHDERAQGDEAEGEGRRVPLLHRQHAEWHGAQAR